MKIKWIGRARRLAMPKGDGERQVLLVEPGETYDVPDGATIAGKGTNWEPAPAKTKSEEK
jgi:hypothetical protein